MEICGLYLSDSVNEETGGRVITWYQDQEEL